ncbi:hypothetical protein BK731_00605 [Bacillus thuringiensis serovar muju]|nr:hypothetical protein [Bacillus thuringiensis]MBH0345657.1 hypothetical protein [Bacillus thuringiensis]OTY11299.1 hypothetical protein BK731_00605 [Bacillus thuringiensis serovar muju]
MTNPNKDKTCFIITPIGDGKSDIRRAADGVIDAVIVPALIEIGLQEDNIKVAHRMANLGSKNKQVITSILQADLVIANLTTLNPNVMYELAIRHAVRKPVIQICQEGTRLPFDITEERTIFYTNDMAGVLELSRNFREMVVQAIEDDEPDNPIYRVIEANTIMKNVKEDDPSRFLLNRMDSLENTLFDFMNTVSNNIQERQSLVKDLNEYERVSSFDITFNNTEDFKPEINNLINEINLDDNGVNCMMVVGKNKKEAKIYINSMMEKDVDFVYEKFKELRDTIKFKNVQ